MKSILKIIILLAITVTKIHAQNYVEAVDKLRLIYQDPRLETTATLIAQSTPVRSNSNPMKVYSYNLYPIMGCIAGDCGLEASKAMAKEDLAHKDHYIGIIKEILNEGDPTASAPTWKVRFTVEIKLPEADGYEEVDALEKEALKNIVQQAINEKYNDFSGFSMQVSIPTAEIFAMEKFKSTLAYLRGGGDINLFTEENGFNKIQISDNNIVRTGAENHLVNSSITIDDYTGFKINDTQFSDFLFNNINVDELIVKSVHYILVSKESSSINEALTQFNNSTRKLIILYYFDFETQLAANHNNIENNRSEKFVYSKSRNNYSKSDANAIIDAKFNDTYDKWHTNSETLPQGATCTPNFEYGKNCIYPSFSTQGENNPVISFGSGLLDGGLGTIHFLLSLVNPFGDISTVELISLMIPTPFTLIITGTIRTVNYFTEPAATMEAREAFSVILKELGQSNEVIKQIFKVIKDASEELLSKNKFLIIGTTTAFKNLADELVKFVLDLFGNIGLGSTVDNLMYIIGLFTFDVVLDLLTGGTAAILSASKLALKGSVVIRKLFAFFREGKSFKDIFSRIISGSKVNVGKTNDILCKMRIGCFVKNTPVLMAGNNPFKAPALAYSMALLPIVSPIQDIKPDDVVKSYHHEQSYYATAGVNEKVYVPGWQDYDYLDITPQTWQIGIFEIIEANGDIVKVEANRPKTWYKENYVNAVGDKAHFYMPEIGINGKATLLCIRPTIINTTNSVLNENGMVDRPVITTFKRNAPIVFDCHFSDGAVISTTPEHPFFSVDRNAYIAVGELQLGEQVMTAGEKVVKFIAGKQRAKGEPVYNFEVWREHNYYVSSKESGEFMLVHNSCWKWGKEYPYSDGVDLPENHIFDRHAHNSLHNRNNTPDNWKSEFSPEWSENIDDLKAFIDLTLENGIAKVIKLVPQGPHKWAVTIDLTDALGPNEFVGRKRKNGSWVNTKIIRVAYDETHQSFVSAFPD